MTETEQSQELTYRHKLAIKIVYAIIIALMLVLCTIAYGCHEYSISEREALKQGWINDRGAWRK